MYTMTTIRVSKETSRKIIELKQKHHFKNADETIKYLIQINEKFDKLKVVKVLIEDE